MNMSRIARKRNELLIRRQGFTLVELLVVIAIIALLLSVLMPALNKARAQGRRIVCASNIHQMNIALVTYVAQEGTYPAITWDVANMQNTYYWTERLIKAGIIKGALNKKTLDYWVDKGQYKSFTCPDYLQITKSKYIWTSLSFAFNDIYLSPTCGKITDANPKFLGKACGKPVIMLIESDHIFVGQDSYFPTGLPGEPPVTAKSIPKRHNGGLNSGWIDGHVEFKKNWLEYTPKMINPNTRVVSQ